MRAVGEVLGQMFGAHVAWACAVPGVVPTEALHPSERQWVIRASLGRRLEMAAGRAAARAALASFGLLDVPLPPSSNGVPRWPPGFVGSITHTRTLACAVVAPSTSFASVGLDAEPDLPLEEALWPLIATPSELAELKTHTSPIAGARARALFCAKEAAYKCQYPATELVLDFEDIEITFFGSGDRMRFEATFRRHAPPFRPGDRIAGHISRVGGYVLASAMLPPRAYGETDDPVSRKRTRTMTFELQREWVFRQEG